MNQGFHMIPVRAMEGRSSSEKGMLWDFFSEANNRGWGRAWECSDRFLQQMWGVTKRVARKLITHLVTTGCVEVVEAGDRHTARRIRVLHPNPQRRLKVAASNKSERSFADHKTDHKTDHQKQSSNSVSQDDRTTKRTTKRTKLNRDLNRSINRDLKPDLRSATGAGARPDSASRSGFEKKEGRGPPPQKPRRRTPHQRPQMPPERLPASRTAQERAEVLWSAMTQAVARYGRTRAPFRHWTLTDQGISDAELKAAVEATKWTFGGWTQRCNVDEYDVSRHRKRWKKLCAEQLREVA